MNLGMVNVTVNKNVACLLRNLIHERVGLYYADSSLEVFIERLTPLVTDHDASFLDFYYLLKGQTAGESTWGEVMDVLTVQETYFWRETDQIDALVGEVVPAYFKHNEEARLRIWVAACATGEEPLTIAMALDQAGWYQKRRIEIHASDASPGGISRARRGIYRSRAFRRCSESIRSCYFTSIDSKHWHVKPELQQRVQYYVANFLDPAAVAEHGNAPVIFCRNVFIYFSPASITRSLNLFAEHMPTPGYLFAGASESLSNFTQRFELREIAGAFTYVKTC